MSEISAKRPRSDSEGSKPEAKRLNLNSSASADAPPPVDEQEDIKPAMEPTEQVEDVKQEQEQDVASKDEATENVPAEESAAQPAEGPVDDAKAVPQMTMKALIVTQDASIIIGKSLLPFSSPSLSPLRTRFLLFLPSFLSLFDFQMVSTFARSETKLVPKLA